MGSVALLTREGEVVIAKNIEEGEREIILSSLSSTHALKEIVKLKTKIENSENPNETVKELVRGLDDESSQPEIKKQKTEYTKSLKELKRFFKRHLMKMAPLKPSTRSKS